MPDTQLESRITRQWGDIGFQGEDPSTDFRGMGKQLTPAEILCNASQQTYYYRRKGLLDCACTIEHKTVMNTRARSKYMRMCHIIKITLGA